MVTKLINNMAKLQKEDLIGKQFGRLTILGYSGKSNGGQPKVMARCDCGVIKEYLLLNIKKVNHTTSCGCYGRERSLARSITHGLRYHPLYRIWADIATRCENPKRNAYKRYGGAGVKMCEEWRMNPDIFIEWALSKGWQKGLHIDKDIIPKKLGIPAILYSPEYCSIITPKENSQHTSRNRYIEYNGDAKCVNEWSEVWGVSKATFWYRIKKCNWDMYLYVKKWNNP